MNWVENKFALSGGKSAILAGIAVGLGGKASATGRGTGITSLIQEGMKFVYSLILNLVLKFTSNVLSPCSKAEVTVVLRNKGERAYKHEIFGEKITVVRTITSRGASTYKIKTAAGKLVSTAKWELDAICDHMDIRVDNPINILTQGGPLSLQKFASAKF